MTVLVAALIDNAREALAAAADAGVQPEVLLVSPAGYKAVGEAKRRESARGFPVRVLGIDIAPSSELADGSVRLRFIEPDESDVFEES